MCRGHGNAIHAIWPGPGADSFTRAAYFPNACGGFKQKSKEGRPALDSAPTPSFEAANRLGLRQQIRSLHLISLCGVEVH